VDDFLQRCTKLKDLVTRRVDLAYISRLPGSIETWTIEAINDDSIAPMLDLIRTTTNLRRLSLLGLTWAELVKQPHWSDTDARVDLQKVCSERDIELFFGGERVVDRIVESDSDQDDVVMEGYTSGASVEGRRGDGVD
jgi:hypothetical protein